MKWLFNGKLYNSIEELAGQTMSEENKPEPVFSLDEMRDCWEQAQRSWSKEIGADLDPEEEAEYPTPEHITDYFSTEYNIHVKMYT